jgi:hypothetical protein
MLFVSRTRANSPRLATLARVSTNEAPIFDSRTFLSGSRIGLHDETLEIVETHVFVAERPKTIVCVLRSSTRCVLTAAVKRLIVGSFTCVPKMSIGFPSSSSACTIPIVPRSIAERKKRVTVESRCTRLKPASGASQFCCNERIAVEILEPDELLQTAAAQTKRAVSQPIHELTLLISNKPSAPASVE